MRSVKINVNVKINANVKVDLKVKAVVNVMVNIKVNENIKINININVKMEVGVNVNIKIKVNAKVNVNVNVTVTVTLNSSLCLTEHDAMNSYTRVETDVPRFLNLGTSGNGRSASRSGKGWGVEWAPGRVWTVGQNTNHETFPDIPPRSLSGWAYKTIKVHSQDSQLCARNRRLERSVL
jgi:hypothetical protein